ETVVAAAARERGLGAERRPLPLPRRAGVVVQPAHESGCELVRDAAGVQAGADGGQGLAARLAQVVGDLGRVAADGLARIVRAVEHAQRICVAPLPALLAELLDVRVE